MSNFKKPLLKKGKKAKTNPLKDHPKSLPRGKKGCNKKKKKQWGRKEVTRRRRNLTCFEWNKSSTLGNISRNITEGRGTKAFKGDQYVLYIWEVRLVRYLKDC